MEHLKYFGWGLIVVSVMALAILGIAFIGTLIGKLSLWPHFLVGIVLVIIIYKMGKSFYEDVIKN